MKKQKEELIRLHKFLSSRGIGSRRYCEALIQKGAVLVNGKTACIGMKIDPTQDRISLQDRGKVLHKASKLHYLMLYKPCGYITSMSDPLSRPTIMELIPSVKERIFPIGRLDFQSEGLLLLTNDGDLAFGLSHPSSMVPKIYQVKVKGKPSLKLQTSLKKGIKLDDGLSAFDSMLEMKSRSSVNTWFKVTIHSGKNRIIRRMFSAIGHPVLKLKRINIAGVDIGPLKPKEWRYLTSQEIRILKGYVNPSMDIDS